MMLTRSPRPPHAGTRRGPASIWTVMLLVLTVVSVHVLCSVHLDDHAHAAGGSVASAGPATSVAQHAHADEPVGEHAHADEPAPAGGDTHGCSDHGVVAAQCDPLLPAPPGPAVLPGLTEQRLVQDVAPRTSAALPGRTTTAAPSLHALGISRT